MGATVGAIGPRRHPHPVTTRKVHAVAQALGCSAATADKKLYGPHAPNLETALILTALIQRGDTDHAALYEAPIVAAMQGEVPPWQVAQYRADCSDAAEDSKQAEWMREQSDENLESYIKALSVDIAMQEKHLASLLFERDRRHAEKHG